MSNPSGRYDQIVNVIKKATSIAVKAALPHRPSLLEQGIIIEAYGSLLRLESLMPAARKRLAQVGESKRPDEQSPETDEAGLLLDELLRFFRCIGRLNAALIDVYYPGLANSLREMYGQDINISYFLARHIEPHYKIQEQHRELINAVLEARLNEWYDYRYYQYFEIGEKNGSDLLEAVERLLPECKVELGRIIRENWKLRDFIEREADIKVEIGSIDASTGRISLGDGAQVQGGDYISCEFYCICQHSGGPRV